VGNSFETGAIRPGKPSFVESPRRAPDKTVEAKTTRRCFKRQTGSPVSAGLSCQVCELAAQSVKWVPLRVQESSGIEGLVDPALHEPVHPCVGTPDLSEHEVVLAAPEQERLTVIGASLVGKGNALLGA
jgi:hypothetical protein